jgi:hypothetical protein
LLTIDLKTGAGRRARSLYAKLTAVLFHGQPRSCSASLCAIFVAFLRLSIVVRGTSEHRSSLVKKDCVSHETFQTDLWPGAHPNWCIPRKLCSYWNREWNLNRLRCWDCALVPLPHLRSWPQKEPPPNLVLLEPRSTTQWRNEPADDGAYSLRRA